MKQITLLATGGTIASAKSKSSAAVTAGINAETLLQSLPEIPKGLEVRGENFESCGSYALNLETVFRLCSRINNLLDAPDVDGIVVTHGTDTMEESAFVAWLLVRSEKPVVFTGAQRHAGLSDTDGPRNIGDALSAAASDDLFGIGPVILFEGDIHGARYGCKTHTSRVDTFRSVGLGKLGEVDFGEVHLYQRPVHARPQVAAQALDPNVELIALGLGTTPKLMALAGDHGASGIILSAFGRGNAPDGFANEIERITQMGIHVVVASRCFEGRTRAVYGNDSGGVSLVDKGAILAGDLSAVKARLLLSACLGAGCDAVQIARAFAV